MDINCRFPRQALHRFIYALFLRFVFLLFLFICFLHSAALQSDMKWPQQWDADAFFFLKNLHKSPGRASSNWSPVNQKHQSVISYTPPPPVFPRRYTAGNLWRAAARCRLCPALWWTPPRRRINGCVLRRQTESEREWDVVLSLLAVCALALNEFSLSKPKNAGDQSCSFLMFWNVKEWTPGINQRVSGQRSRAFPLSEFISKEAAGPAGKQLDPLHISVASTVRLCHSAVSRSKALATVMVPLCGSILKAPAPLLLLSIEYLRTGTQTRRRRRRNI